MLRLDKRASWDVILEILEQEEEGSVTIVALGPCKSPFTFRTGPICLLRRHIAVNRMAKGHGCRSDFGHRRPWSNLRRSKDFLPEKP